MTEVSTSRHFGTEERRSPLLRGEQSGLWVHGGGLHARPAGRVSHGACALVAMTLLMPVGPARGAEATAWAKGAHSAARLIDGGAASEAPGTRRVGLEVRLDPAFITYWRNPGDAGVPPTFTFAGSTNLKSADVSYPAPGRLAEAGAAAYGYSGDVTFPIAVTPLDPAQPVSLRVDLAYAVCHEICLPVRAALSIALEGTPSAEASRVRAAFEAVPRPAAIGQSVAGLAILRARPAPAGGIAVEAQAPEGSTLFVEAPDAFDFEAQAPEPAADGRLLFPVKRVDGPENAPAPPLTLTLVAPGDPPKAIEVKLQLDAAAKTP